MNLLAEHVGLARVREQVAAADLGAVDLGVLLEERGDEGALLLGDLLLLLELIIFLADGLVVVLQLDAVKHPVVALAVGAVAADLPDRNARAALALVEEVLALAQDRGLLLLAAAVALADVALADLGVLVSFVPSLGETN